MNWQPIETAPKDRRILLFLVGASRSSVGQWEAEVGFSKPMPYWSSDLEGWNGIKWMRANQPTHWMDIPPAPQPGVPR